MILAISTGIKTVIMIVAMIAVFYFFLIRPQSQKAKAEEQYRNNLKKGDRVMTAGGIHGTFIATEGVYSVVEVAQNTTIKVQTSTINPIPEQKQ